MDEGTRNSYLSQGIVLVGGIIDRHEAVEVLAGIEYLARNRPAEDVKLLINSPGGMANYSLAIYDELRKLPVNIATGCAGMADGSAAMLLAAGTRGRRGALAHAVIHVTDVWSVRDCALTPEDLKGIEKLRKRFTDAWVEAAGQAEDTVRGWMNSQKRFSAEEALDAGIIDFVVEEDDKRGGEKDGCIPGLFRPGQD